MIQHFKRPSAMRPGTSMPPIQLSDAQLNSLAAFLLKLNDRNATALDNAPDFAREGALVYQANHCGTCHLVNGVGMKVGPPLNGLSKRRNPRVGWRTTSRIRKSSRRARSCRRTSCRPKTWKT